MWCRYLKGRYHVVGRDLVFGEGEGGYSNWSKSKAHLDARLSIPAWRLHDIRRSVATGMAEIGIQPHIIEAVLNQSAGKNCCPDTMGGTLAGGGNWRDREGGAAADGDGMIRRQPSRLKVHQH
jgi:hypothetical protein